MGVTITTWGGLAVVGETVAGSAQADNINVKNETRQRWYKVASSVDEKFLAGERQDLYSFFKSRPGLREATKSADVSLANSSWMSWLAGQ